MKIRTMAILMANIRKLIRASNELTSAMICFKNVTIRAKIAKMLPQPAALYKIDITLKSLLLQLEIFNRWRVLEDNSQKLSLFL